MLTVKDSMGNHDVTPGLDEGSLGPVIAWYVDPKEKLTFIC